MTSVWKKNMIMREKCAQSLNNKLFTTVHCFYVLQHLNKWDKKWMRNGQYTTNHIRINTKEKR